MPVAAREAFAPAQAYLQLDVRPATAEIFVNDRYQGQIQGWTHQIVIVPAGLVALELRQAGYITQRLDLTLVPDQSVTLRLDMEPEWEDLANPAPAPTPTPRTPEHPFSPRSEAP